MSKKSTEVAVVATEEQLAILDESYPIEDNLRAPQIPRLGFLAKDEIEETGTGKNKKIKVIQSGGTFFKEVQTDEVNEKTGKNIWEKQYFGDQEPLEAVIFFHRKQLRMYDSVDKVFINTPIYDDASEILPLYKGNTKIDEGTPAQLQAKYPALTQKSKPTSKLKEEKIIYLLLIEDGQVYQMNLSQSSKFAFGDYSRRNKVNHLVTVMGMSEEMTSGSNTYRHIVFSPKRTITKDEADLIVPAVAELNNYVAAKKQRFAKSEPEKVSDEDVKYDNL